MVAARSFMLVFDSVEIYIFPNKLFEESFFFFRASSSQDSRYPFFFSRLEMIKDV